MSRHPLPLTVPIRYSWNLSILLIAVGVLFVWCGFLPPSNFADQGPLAVFVMKYIAPLLGSFSLFAWTSMNLLGRTYLRISRETLEYHHLFGTQRLAWKDVVDIATYSIKNNDMVGFVAKQNTRGKRSFWRSVNVALGVNYALSFPLGQVHGIDKHELVRLLKDLHENTFEPGEPLSLLPEDSEEHAQVAGNLSLALVTSLAFAWGLGCLDALILILGRTHLLVLPLVGISGASYCFFRFLRPQAHRWIHRIYLGGLGLFTVWLTRVLVAVLGSGSALDAGDFIQTFLSYPAFLARNPGSEFTFLLLGVATAGLGFSLGGPSLGLFQKFVRPFLKRRGSFLYKIDERVFTIYVAAPELVDEEGNLPTLRITKGCRIETEGKDLRYFQIPAKILQETGIRHPTERMSLSDDRQFLDVPFGGAGTTKEYVFDCFLVVDSQRNLLAIRLEIH